MNNPLIFTDPSGYRPDLIFEEEERYRITNPGQDVGGIGGGWNPFGWISRSMNIGGWTKNPDDYWHYSSVSGTYYNSETGETINPTIDYHRYKETIEPHIDRTATVEIEKKAYVGGYAVMPDGSTFMPGKTLIYTFSNPIYAANRGDDWLNNAFYVNSGLGSGSGILAGNYGLTANQTFKYGRGILVFLHIRNIYLGLL